MLLLLLLLIPPLQPFRRQENKIYLSHRCCLHTGNRYRAHTLIEKLFFMIAISFSALFLAAAGCWLLLLQHVSE